MIVSIFIFIFREFDRYRFIHFNFLLTEGSHETDGLLAVGIRLHLMLPSTLGGFSGSVDTHPGASLARFYPLLPAISCHSVAACTNRAHSSGQASLVPTSKAGQ